MQEFSFEDYDTEKLKEKQNPELLKKNVKTENPGYYDDVEKPREFMNLEDSKQLFKQKQHREMDDETLSLPYDSSLQGNSYLSLVLSPNLRELELMIRGLEYVQKWNELTGKYEYRLRKIPNHPLNEYGINQIITQLKIYTSPEIKLGRKTTKDYYNSVQHVAKTIVRLIYKNLKSFGMDTQEKQRNAKMFCDAIIEVIDSSYSRSIGGKENDLSRATDFRVEGRIDNMDEISSFMKGRNKDNYKN